MDDCMLNYPAISSLYERERGAAHMQGTVFTLAKLNSSYYQELVSQPIPVCC